MSAHPFAHLLCPVDFSDASIHGVEHAIAVAGWSAARLTLLNVRPGSTALVADLPVAGNVMPAADMDRAQEQISQCLRLARKAGVSTDVLVDVGQPAADIVSRATSLHADLIVMGTHGAGGFDRLVLGSVTEKVLRQALCPVLTVPPRARTTSALPFRRVLCAIDFSAPSLESLSIVLPLAEEAGASITLLHIIEWPWAEPPAPAFGELPAAQASVLQEFRAQTEASASAKLRSLVSGATSDRVRITPRIANGKAYQAILHVAEEEASDLIVMGVYGRGAIDTMLLGSTTNQVVRRATCPVLTLRHP